MVLDNDFYDINPFADFILYIGGIPVVVLFFVVVFVVITCLVFNLTKSRRKAEFLFHKRVFYVPLKSKFARDWLQYYFFDLTYGEVVLMCLHVFLCLVWFFWHNGYSLEYPGPFFYPIQRLDSARDVSNGFGRVAMLNYVLVLFPAQRFSVVQVVFRVGFEKGLKYHKIIGVVAFVAVWLHFLFLFVEFSHFYSTDAWRQFWLMVLSWNKEEVMNSTLPGLLSGLALVVLIVTSAGVVRKYAYSLFWWIHMASALVSFVMLVFHRKVITAVLVSFGLLTTLLDFLYRAINYAVPARITSVDVFPKNNILTIELSKPVLTNHQSGQIVFLWIPRANFFISHPFTLISTSADPTTRSMKLMIFRRGKFTSYLFKTGLENPAKLRKAMVRVDGVYGTKIEFADYDGLILVSRNSGAAVHFGVLRELVHKRLLGSLQVVFLWVLANRSYLEIFEKDLRFLVEKGVNFKIFDVSGKGKMNMKGSILGSINTESEAKPILGGEVKDAVDTELPIVDEKMVFSKELGLMNGERIGIGIYGPPKMKMEVKEACWKSGKKIHLIEPVESM